MKKRFPTAVLCSLALLSALLFTSASARAEDGRYRAVVLEEGAKSGGTGSFFPKVFIIDSREGHMWTWQQKTKVRDAEGRFGFGSILTYQGKVREGKKMGEVIEQARD